MLTIQNLEHEEYDVYTLLEEKYPDLTDDFLRKVSVARFKIMERLVNALLRENIIKNGDSYSKEEKENMIKVTILDSAFLIPIAKKYSYNRYEIINNVVTRDKQGNQTKLIHPLDFLELLMKKERERGYTYPNLDLFQKEVANSVANMALALLFEDVRKQLYTKICQEKNWSSTMELVKGLSIEDASFDKVTFFEQLCVTGHHQHPCTKSKVDFTPEEVICYSPEFGKVISLAFVALHKDMVYYRTENENVQLNQIWYHDYPELYDQFYVSCLNHGKDIEDYILIPVHPWQWENVILRMYSKEIEQGHIFYIRNFRINTRSTLSVRTLAPIEKEKKYHIKLPLNVQMTNAVRLISPNAVQNGPELTRLLRQILRLEKNFDGKLNIVGESIGVRFKSTNIDQTDDDKNRNLSILLRDNPLSLLKDDEIAIVGCALFNSSPVAKKSILVEMIERYHTKNGDHILEDHVLLFFRKYVEVLLNGTIPLMTRYGIGLEGHLQNTLIVFKDNEPNRIIVRDLGGIRVDVRRLEKQGYFGEFHPDSAIISSDLQDMHNKIIHSVFQNHLGELTLHLSNHFNMEESLLWNVIRNVCHEVFANLKEDTSLEVEVNLDMNAIFAPIVKTKAITVMRLFNDVTNYTYTCVPNPLSEKEHSI